MPGAGAVLFFLALLVAAWFLEPVAERARVPQGVLLVPLGFVASEIATRGLGVDLGVRWDNLGRFMTSAVVPVLVFESALRLDAPALRRVAWPVFLLSVPLLLAGAALTAVLVFLGMGDPEGFPWTAALLAGAILASTEMTGMFRLLESSGVPGRVCWILEGESIFNDTAAIVLFTGVLAVATLHADEVTAGGVATLFLRLAAGGVAVGCAWGWLARRAFRRRPDPQSFALLSLATAYGVFVLAQHVLHVSGAMAVLCAGLMLCADARQEQEGFAGEFWHFAARLAGALVFILAGVGITRELFADQWLAMLIGAGSALLARGVVVFGLLGPACRGSAAPLALRDQAVLTWGAVRGSVTLALALSLPLALDYWYPLQGLVYGAVLFSLFVQATTISRLAEKPGSDCLFPRPGQPRPHGENGV